MKKELSQCLIEKYPRIFADVHEEKDQTETAMVWGFEHGDGWFHIVDGLCSAIQGIVDSYEDKQMYEKRKEIAIQEHGNDYNVEDLPDAEDVELTEEEKADVRAVQVKEKFGGLRFYIKGAPTDIHDKVQGAIRMAESMSFRTCEECGTTENVEVRDDGWIETLCDDCNE